MREQVLKAIEKEKLIVIVRGVSSEDIIPLANALYNGGVRLMEITYDATGVVSDEETAKTLKKLKDHVGDKMFIGAGTVLTEKQVELTKKAGGEFIISPDAYSEVIKKTRELDMVSIPGAITPTEVQSAYRSGADFVKLFPLTNLGIDYFKNIKAPLSHVKYLAVGGITESNISEYLKAGVSGFGIGGNIVNKQFIKSGNFEKITEIAKKYCDLIKG